MKLTKRVIDKLIYQGPKPKRHVVWDDKVAGFGVRVYPTGKKAFVLSYRIHTRKRLMTVASVGVLTVEQARDYARKYLASIVDGADPLEKRQQELRGETVRDLCIMYIERYAKPRKKTWQGDEGYLNKHVVPVMGNLKISSVQQIDVAKLHMKIGEHHPYAANRVVEILAKMFKLASVWGMIENHHRNPAHGIDHFKEKKRDRWLTHEELPRVAQAIMQEENVYVRNAFFLYLLTGARKNELLTAKWDYIDWANRLIRFPETKSGRPHYLPLSQAALTILHELPRLDGNPYLLPGHKQGQPLINIDKAWRRIRTRAKVEDVRLHDLRRTVGSMLAQSGHSLPTIGKILNHQDSKTTMVYTHFAQEHIRSALEHHGEEVLQLTGLSPISNALDEVNHERR